MGYFQVRYDSRVVIYDRRGFIRLATACCCLRRGSVSTSDPNESHHRMGVLVIKSSYPIKHFVRVWAWDFKVWFYPRFVVKVFPMKLILMIEQQLSNQMKSNQTVFSLTERVKMSPEAKKVFQEIKSCVRILSAQSEVVKIDEGPILQKNFFGVTRGAFGFLRQKNMWNLSNCLSCCTFENL